MGNDLIGTEMLEKGGVVMYILVVLSIYAVSVILYKIFQFTASGVLSNSFIPAIMDDVRKGELTAAENKLIKKHGSIATVMKVAIACVTNRNMSSKSREAEISRVGAYELQALESHIRGLELVANTSPLLGLLGTVIGMVKAFAKLGEAGSRVDPAMLAGGIWEALLTTVGGLIVAIPAVAVYYIIDGIIEKTRSRMRDVSIQIIALEDEFIRNDKEQERREIAEKEKKLREQQEALEETMLAQRSTAQTSGTLRLLSPLYK